jgi:hypothetical protein
MHSRSYIERFRRLASEGADLGPGRVGAALAAVLRR